MKITIFAESEHLPGKTGKLLFTTIKNIDFDIMGINLQYYSDIVILETKQNTLRVIKDRSEKSTWIVNSSTLYYFKDPEVEAFLSERLKFLDVKEVIDT
jgi:arabinogalactan endo-1,4-beta-galactosidase